LDLWVVHSHAVRLNGQLGEVQTTLERSLCLMQKESTDLRETHSREIGALSLQFAQENERDYRDIETNIPITTTKLLICKVHITTVEEYRENCDPVIIKTLVS
jgi:hypothetical protein